LDHTKVTERGDSYVEKGKICESEGKKLRIQGEWCGRFPQERFLILCGGGERTDHVLICKEECSNEKKKRKTCMVAKQRGFMAQKGLWLSEGQHCVAILTPRPEKREEKKKGFIGW